MNSIQLSLWNRYESEFITAAVLLHSRFHIDLAIQIAVLKIECLRMLAEAEETVALLRALEEEMGRGNRVIPSSC